MRGGVQMNTRKDRYAVRISESSYIEMQEQALRDGAKQGIAVALVALEKALGWRKIRLERVYSVVDELLHLPQIFGHDVTADDAIAYLRKTYGIDVDQLDVCADAGGKE